MRTLSIVFALLIGAGLGYGVACVRRVPDGMIPEPKPERPFDYFEFPGAPWAEATLFHGWFVEHDAHLPMDRQDLYLQIAPRQTEDKIVLEVYKLTSPHGGKAVMSIEFRRSDTYKSAWR